MKIIYYYASLLIFVGLLSGFLLTKNANSMTMPEMLTICVAFVAYTIAISIVGEGKSIDEREMAHRYLSARVALIAGTIFISLSLCYQIFTHQLDYLLLISLVIINLGKIVSLIYQHYRH